LAQLARQARLRPARAGSAREIDLDPYLQGPLLEPIRRSRTLFASVYVDPDTETLTWPNGADIDPDVLYYDGNPPWVVEENQSGCALRKAGRIFSLANCPV
jgi:hypothetical protein